MESAIHKTYGQKLRVRASGILIKNDKVLLIKHNSIGKGGILWAPPGGGIEFGEDAHTCLVREFKEETNLNVKVGKLLFVNEYIEHPLHAIELFFEIYESEGDLKLGHDPEMTSADQIIKEIKFLSIEEIKAAPAYSFHSIFNKINKLENLHNIYGYHKNLNMS
jgi:8-oxo-dGTP diphosphatase